MSLLILIDTSTRGPTTTAGPEHRSAKCAAERTSLPKNRADRSLPRSAAPHSRPIWPALASDSALELGTVGCTPCGGRAPLQYGCSAEAPGSAVGRPIGRPDLIRTGGQERRHRSELVNPMPGRSSGVAPRIPDGSRSPARNVFRPRDRRCHPRPRAIDPASENASELHAAVSLDRIPDIDTDTLSPPRLGDAGGSGRRSTQQNWIIKPARGARPAARMYRLRATA